MTPAQQAKYLARRRAHLDPKGMCVAPPEEIPPEQRELGTALGFDVSQLAGKNETLRQFP